MKTLTDFYIPPMPEIQEAIVHINSAKQALNRQTWNKAQLEDVINSVEFFMNKAKESLK